MLGSLKSASIWNWAAFGKHSVAGDYFNSGSNDPLFQAFSGWVENGFRQVCTGTRKLTDLHAWRFWAKGHQKDTLIFGMVRDSFDTIGRPYPLMIMGTGILPEWQIHFGLLPFALEKVWIQMESLATKRFIDFSQLESDIRRLPVPEAQWSTFENQAHHRRQAWIGTGDLKTSDHHATEPEFLVQFDDHSCQDVITAAGLWHGILMEQCVSVPNAAFLGGNLNATYLVVFRRPLGIPDFVRLWSVGSETNPSRTQS